MGNLHVFHGTLIDLRYLDEIIDLYSRHYVSAFGNDFILMNNNSKCQGLWLLKTILRVYGLVRMEWPAYSPDQKTTEHLFTIIAEKLLS